MASSETALTNLLAHCTAVKAAAIAAGNNSSHCLTIARFLGKGILQLEALYQVEGVAGPYDDILDDFFDAVNAISDAVSSVSRMSRLQALFQAEDIRDSLRASASDLRAAVATLAPLQSFLPPDAKEDFTTLERQLASMKLGSRPNGILAAQTLLWALTLGQEAAAAVTTTVTPTATVGTDNTTTATPSSTTTTTTTTIQSALQTALSQAGLASVPAEIWLDGELAALARGVLNSLETEPSHPIDAFHLAAAALALLDAAVLGKLYHTQEGNITISTTNNSKGVVDLEEEEKEEEEEEEEDAAWEKLVVENLEKLNFTSGGDIEGDRSLGSEGSLLTTTCRSRILASTFHLTSKTRGAVETALQAVGKFAETTSSEEKLRIDDYQGLCKALSSPPPSQTTPAAVANNNGNSKKHRDTLCNGSSSKIFSYAVLLRQYKAAVLISHSAEYHGSTKRLLEAGAIPAVLTALESSNHTSVRTAAATALRMLCRDASAREAAAAAGCLSPLARLMQNQHAGPRRAAARAFGNIIVAGEGYKREAVEKYSIPGSLIAMLRSDDALGQEAAALAIANLAANSEHVQTALGKTDIFNPLSEVLHTAIGMTTTTSMFTSAAAAVAQHAAARAVRNLTSRVQFNRLKASAAGTVPGLVALLHSPDPVGRSVAASALATVMDGCSDALSQAVSAGATTELLKILQDDSSLACRDAAACAVVHIVQANALQQQNSNSSTSTSTTATGTATAVIKEYSDFSVGISTSALPALIDLLATATPSGRHAAARLLVFLAKYKSKDAVVAASAVTHLVPLLSAKHDSVRRQATKALCVLMHRCDAARIQFLEAKGMSLLVSLLEKKSGEVEESTRQEAARALGILCANNKFSQGAIAASAGAIKALVDIIKEGKENTTTTTSQGASPFSSSSTTASFNGTTTTPGAASSIRFAAATQEAAAVALSNLACLPSNQSGLADTGAGQALLRLLRNDAPSGCRVAAARGISNMVADGMPEELTRSVSDMVLMLAELAMPSEKESKNIVAGSKHQNNDNSHVHGHHHHHYEHQVAAACALGNLACADAHGAAAVAKYGGAAVLAQLCRSEIPSVREAAAQGLWESCRGSPEARHVAAVQFEVVPWLVQMLIVGEDAGKEAAAGCLAELTRCGELVCAAAEEAGAPLLLERLADHGSVDVAGAAAAALKALKRRSPDSPSLEHELSQRLSSLRELGSRRFDSGGEEEDDMEAEIEG